MIICDDIVHLMTKFPSHTQGNVFLGGSQSFHCYFNPVFTLAMGLS